MSYLCWTLEATVESVLRKLTFRRFRSIPQGAVEFDNPTFLVGKNGSGKSNIVDAIAFLAESMYSPLQAVFDTRGGISAVRNRTSQRGYPPNLGLAVDLGAINGELRRAHYAFEVRALPNYGFEVVREQCVVVKSDGTQYSFDRIGQKFTPSPNLTGLEPLLDSQSLGLPVIAGDTRFQPVLRALVFMRTNSIEPTKLREMQEPDSGNILRRDGSNAASVLQEIQRQRPDDVRRICQYLSTIVPSTTNVRPRKHGNKLSLEFVQEWGSGKPIRFEAFNMSDGTLRALGLLTAVYQIPKPSVLVIEEPEATIHPGALGAILDLLRHAAGIMQVVITTHSPEVLDAEWIEDRHIRIVDWRDGTTCVGPVSEASRAALRDHLMGAGELLRANALDAQPLFEQQNAGQGSLFEDMS